MPRPPSCTKTGNGIRKWIWNPVREGGKEERHHRSHAKRHIRGARSQAGLLTRRSRRFRRPSRYRMQQWPIAVLKHSLLTVARPCGNCTRFPFHSQDCREHLALTAANASKWEVPRSIFRGRSASRGEGARDLGAACEWRWENGWSLTVSRVRPPPVRLRAGPLSHRLLYRSEKDLWRIIA